jgi:two-component system, OmpR family, KDP operon response regulator KdpE
VNEKVLIIDDETTLAEMVSLRLEPKGYEILSARNGTEGIRMAYQHHPDLIILDVMMPEMDGWETCRRIRELSDVPIVMLTAKVNEEDVVRGFRLGADDYVKKPFSLQELEERIRVILKRTNSGEKELNTIYDDGKLRIDLERQQVIKNGQPIHLTSTEFRLLSCLFKHQGITVPHDELLTEVWGPAYLDATACLSLYIRYLREKIEDNPSEPQYIRTKWGAGYWFAPTQI